MIPFVVWVSIYFWWMAFWGKYVITPLFIVNSILSNSLLHLYFLPLIAELYLITPLLWNYVFSRSKTVQLVLTVVFFILGIGLYSVAQYHPWLNPEHSIFTVFIPYIGYYLAGALLRNIKISNLNFALLFLILIGVLIVLYIWRGADVNSSVVMYLNPLMVLFSLSLFIILQKIFSTLSLVSNHTKLVIRFVSATILGIYLLHIIVRDVVGVIPIFNPYSVHSPILLFVFVYIFIVFFISFGIVALTQKIPYIRAIFG